MCKANLKTYVPWPPSISKEDIAEVWQCKIPIKCGQCPPDLKCLGLKLSTLFRSVHFRFENRQQSATARPDENGGWPKATSLLQAINCVTMTSKCVRQI